MNARTDGLPKRQIRPLHPELPSGIAYRNRRKPYIVKFCRNKHWTYIGSFFSLPEAIWARDQYLCANPAHIPTFNATDALNQSNVSTDQPNLSGKPTDSKSKAESLGETP